MKLAGYPKNHNMLLLPLKRTGLTILIFLIFQVTNNIYGYSGKGQEDHPKKQVKAIKIKSKIKIDGQLTETAWEKAPTATNFITYSPSMGKNSDYTTKVKTVYNDKAIYFGAFLKDKPDSIIAGLSKRDEQNVNADRFWVTLNPFNDGKNIFKFIVTAANVQSDVKISPANENEGYGEPGDAAWDVVWKSSVSIVDSGWVVEMEIPYDAIRFPKKEVQKWGINFWRTVRRERKISSWDFVDRTMENEGTQYGELVNLYDIEPPLRLSLYPYVSGYIFPHNGNLDYEYSAGMDLKYGINESFTLDMILIPDFGQKKSDETVLNLSPYEIKYDEKRQFLLKEQNFLTRQVFFIQDELVMSPPNIMKFRKK